MSSMGMTSGGLSTTLMMDEAPSRMVRISLPHCPVKERSRLGTSKARNDTCESATASSILVTKNL